MTYFVYVLWLSKVGSSWTPSVAELEVAPVRTADLLPAEFVIACTIDYTRVGTKIFE